MPDLRESTYSANDRVSVARDSVTPSLGRTSVAASMYRHNAVVDPPAQTGIRGKAAVVRVKNSNTNSPTESRAPSPPPMPAMDQNRYVLPKLKHSRAPPSPAFSVGSTFLNGTADTAQAVTARPVMVHKGSKPDAQAAAAATAASNAPASQASSTRARRDEKSLSVFEDISSEDDKSPRKPRLSWMRGRSREPTVAEHHQSPFSDTMASTVSPSLSGRSPARGGAPTFEGGLSPTISGKTTGFGHNHSGSLSKVIEEATRRASARPTHGGLGGMNREPSPFSDANEVK